MRLLLEVKHHVYDALRYQKLAHVYLDRKNAELVYTEEFKLSAFFQVA